MPITEKVTLHALPPSHPCAAVAAALEHKGVEYEWVDLEYGRHNEQIAELYGEGARTVPGLTIGEERIHGSTAIMPRLDELVPDNPLYPEGIAEEVRAAETWGDERLQDLGRRIPWGALHFRPERLGRMNGIEELDPAGTDFAMRFIRATWKYHDLSSVRIAEDLRELPALVEEVEGFAREGVIDGPAPTAADFQIGATIRVLLTIGDVVPILEGTAAERIARNNFDDYGELVPAGAFPASWLPSP